MNKLIACCGLNCETCDAYIATLKDDDNLRKQTAEKWQQMFNAPAIDPSAINCTGCRSDGVKFSHCNECGIRKCTISKGYQTCGECSELSTCSIVAMVHQYMPEAVQNLQKLN